MILYLIRFSLALTCIYGFYKFVLEREKAFHFNRLFLLAGLILSLIIPLISFSGPETFKSLLSATQQSVDQNIIEWEFIFNLLYFLVSGILLLRFGIDTFKLIRKAQSGKLKVINGTQVILTPKSHPPYSFLSYVFISEQNFDQIQPELIDHEIAHVKQGHTIDILFIEFVKACLWINPMLGLFKRAMRLNHEFLADQAAITRSVSIADYQHTLLRYFMAQKTPSIASGFNFSLTKKRFQMMTQTKSKTHYLRKMLVIPLFVFIIWACSDNSGVTGKEMLKYWRYTASMEEILRTGGMNEKDLNEGILLPIENRKQYNELQDIYSRMNNTQKKSVYELPPYLAPIESDPTD